MNSLDICNSALSKLGVEPISSFEEESKAARLCELQYDLIRQKLIRDHKWNFATARISIVPDETVPGTEDTPVFGEGFLFSITVDSVRILRVGDGETTAKDSVLEIPHKIEGSKIIADTNPLDIMYLKDITDVDLMDVSFREALAWLLAAELSYPIIHSTSQALAFKDNAADEIRSSRSLDACEGTPEEWNDDSWLASRVTRAGFTRTF